jgi:hypothetical protein
MKKLQERDNQSEKMEATTSGESMVQENRKEEDRVRESEQRTEVREVEQEISLSGKSSTF